MSSARELCMQRILISLNACYLVLQQRFFNLYNSVSVWKIPDQSWASVKENISGGVGQLSTCCILSLPHWYGGPGWSNDIRSKMQCRFEQLLLLRRPNGHQAFICYRNKKLMKTSSLFYLELQQVRQECQLLQTDQKP